MRIALLLCDTPVSDPHSPADCRLSLCWNLKEIVSPLLVELIRPGDIQGLVGVNASIISRRGKHNLHY